jgi:NCS2 family nucleobase:cation symporter-2/xanthine permease XanP
MRYNDSLLYEVDEKPPPVIGVFMALQHVLLIFSGILFAPIVVGRACDLDQGQVQYLMFAAVVVSGITIIAQVKKIGAIGSGYLLFLGPAAAFIAVDIQAIQTGGLALAAVLAILAAPFEVAIAYSMRHIRKVISPTVGGIVILLIAVNLIDISADLIRDFGNEQVGRCYAIGFTTFAVTLVISLSRNKYLRLWAPTGGILVGIGVAFLVGLMGLTQFRAAPWLGLPPLKHPGFSISLSSETLSLFVLFCLTTVVGTLETVGDAMAVQEASRRRFHKVDYDAVKGALNADAFGNVLSGLFGVIPNTTYSGNTPVIKITGVASRQIGVFSGIILLLLALSPRLSALFLDIPNPVYGGSMLFLCVILGTSGFGLILADTAMGNRFRFMLSFSLFTGILCQFTDLAAGLPFEWMRVIFGNSISSGGTVAVALSLIYQIADAWSPSCRIRFAAKDLDEARRIAESIADRFKLAPDDALRANLVIEEICEFFRSRDPAGEGTLRVLGSVEEDRLTLEFVSEVRIEDVDGRQARSGAREWSEAELEGLGLVLVNLVAESVAHDRVGGFNYITVHLRLLSMSS